MLYHPYYSNTKFGIRFSNGIFCYFYYGHYATIVRGATGIQGKQKREWKQ